MGLLATSVRTVHREHTLRQVNEQVEFSSARISLHLLDFIYLLMHIH